MIFLGRLASLDSFMKAYNVSETKVFARRLFQSPGRKPKFRTLQFDASDEEFDSYNPLELDTRTAHLPEKRVTPKHAVFISKQVSSYWDCELSLSNINWREQ